MSYEYLEGIFNSYKGKDASYISRNRIHLIFDPSNKLHSGEKIEKTRNCIVLHHLQVLMM